MYRCNTCGSGYLDPRPNSATIGLAYSSYHTHTSVIDVEQSVKSAWRRHRIAQRNAYLNSAYGYELYPSNARSPYCVSRDRRQRWDKQVGYLRYPGRGARLLDIGCGNGRFLLQMRAAGWDVSGVEADPASAAQAIEAGLNVKVGTLENLALPDSYFDAVSLHHVLEHLHRPLETLRRCRAVLKPGGTIVIATPNFSAVGHVTFGPDWFPLQSPTHLVLFTPESLRLALEMAGFVPEPLCRLRLVAMEIYRKSFHIYRRGNPMRLQPPLSLFDKMCVAWLAWKANRTARIQPGLAEELVLLARRKD